MRFGQMYLQWSSVEPCKLETCRLAGKSNKMEFWSGTQAAQKSDGDVLESTRTAQKRVEKEAGNTGKRWWTWTVPWRCFGEALCSNGRSKTTWVSDSFYEIYSYFNECDHSWVVNLHQAVNNITTEKVRNYLIDNNKPSCSSNFKSTSFACARARPRRSVNKTWTTLPSAPLAQATNYKLRYGI